MSWHKLSPPSRSLGDSLTVGIVAATPKDKARCIIRVGRALAQRGGLPHEAKGPVNVYFGRAADAGRMKIEASASGEYVAHPQNLRGAVKIAVVPPPGSPPEYEAAPVDARVEEEAGGLTFPLPWHKRAADREVTEPEVCRDDEKVEAPPLTGPPEIAPPPTLDAIEEEARPAPDSCVDPDCALLDGTCDCVGIQDCRYGTVSGKSQSNARVAPARLPPPSSRRPFPGEPVTEAELLAGLEKPVNNPERIHVYADSPSGEETKPFTHKDKTVHLTEPEYAIAHRLYKVMKKGVRGQFLDLAVISTLAKTKDIAVRHLIMTRLTAKMETVDLLIGVQKGMGAGYWMQEDKT